MTIRPYQPSDLPAMTAIWNEVVEEGVAFPQLETLDEASGERFFAAQTHTAVAVDDAGAVRGLYILHPNNVGRCGHIANASFAVSSLCRGKATSTPGICTSGWAFSPWAPSPAASA